MLVTGVLRIVLMLMHMLISSMTIGVHEADVVASDTLTDIGISGWVDRLRGVAVEGGGDGTEGGGGESTDVGVLILPLRADGVYLGGERIGAADERSGAACAARERGLARGVGGVERGRQAGGEVRLDVRDLPPRVLSAFRHFRADRVLIGSSRDLCGGVLQGR